MTEGVTTPIEKQGDVIKVPFIIIDSRGYIWGSGRVGSIAAENMTAPSGRQIVQLPNYPLDQVMTLRGKGYDTVTGEIFDLEDNPAEFSSYVIDVDGEATATLPAGTIVQVSGDAEALDTHPGGVFSFGSDVPGFYTLIIDSFPQYRVRRYQIEVTV
jgi:hypothetical protein